jgi:hypothetical protein
MLSIRSTLLDLPLRHRRSATTLALHQHHRKTGGFEQLGRCLADFWVVVLQEGIVKEHHLATPGLLGRTRSCGEPGAKRLPGKRWQRALRRNAKALLGPLAQDAACQPIGQGGDHLPQTVYSGDMRKQLRPQGRAMLGIIMAQKLVLEFSHVHIRGAFGFTRLALQTQVEHVVESMAGEFGLWQTP